MATYSWDKARGRLLDISENDIGEDDVWYRISRYDYPEGVVGSLNKVHIAVRWTDSIITRLEIEAVVNQYEAFQPHILENEDDYWIDDIDVT
jgi:hypothetical protein